MVLNRLKRIKLLILDIDGVFTDGSIIYNDNAVETKVFNVKDGLGIRLLMEVGIDVCIITGRRSDALHHRCKNLGIDLIFTKNAYGKLKLRNIFFSSAIFQNSMMNDIHRDH